MAEACYDLEHIRCTDVRNHGSFGHWQLLGAFSSHSAPWRFSKRFSFLGGNRRIRHRADVLGRPVSTIHCHLSSDKSRTLLRPGKDLPNEVLFTSMAARDRTVRIDGRLVAIL